VPEGTYVNVGSGTWCVTLYKAFNVRIVQAFGLTDAVLARVPMRRSARANKHGLLPLAQDLVALLDAYGEPGVGDVPHDGRTRAGPGVDRGEPGGAGTARRKVYNRHDFWENLRAALTRVPAVVVE